jgi:hypothetical protein
VPRISEDFTEPFGKELLTHSEVAKALRVNIRRVRRWGTNGTLTPCFAHGKVRFLGTEVATLRAQLSGRNEW